MDVNKPNKGGATPFYIACQSGQYEIVKLLMEFEGVDITKIEGIDNCTPFYIACSQGKLGIVKLLMKDPRTDINQVQLFGASPFHIACQNGQIDIVKLLLNDPRTNINEQDVDDISPLMRACYEERIEIVKILLRHPGIKVNPDIGEDGIGMSPFFIACRHGYIEMAKLLLKEKRVELDNLNSRTSPFYIACQEGHLEIIKWMLISEREIDFTRQCQNRKITPKQQAKILSTLGPMNYETNEDAQIRQQTSLEIYNLLADFENNPLRVKNQLKRSFNLRSKIFFASFISFLSSNSFAFLKKTNSFFFFNKKIVSSDLFVIVIFLLDEYLCLKDEANESIQRFFFLSFSFIFFHFLSIN